jgi:hypothetical protein
MLNHFRFIPFLAGIAIGGATLFFYKPDKQIIKQYPHPSEAHEKVFKDPNGTCYKYTSHEVDCDANEGTLTDYPVQG